MKLAIFGANGVTGRILTQRAVDAGHDVSAVTRRPDAFPIEHPRLRVVGGDALDPATASTALAADTDAVLSVLGVPFSRTPIDIYSAGVANIVAAMGEHGVRRIVAVSSSAVERHDSPDEGWLFTKVLEPYFVGVVGRTTYDDMRAMEARLRTSGLDWTVIRPSGLFESPDVTDYAVSPTHLTGRFTSRTDLADLLLREASSSAHLGTSIEIRTTEHLPSFLAFLWKEGIAKRA